MKNYYIFFTCIFLFVCMLSGIKLKKNKKKGMMCQHVFIKNKATGEYLFVSNISDGEKNFLVFKKNYSLLLIFNN